MRKRFLAVYDEALWLNGSPHTRQHLSGTVNPMIRLVRTFISYRTPWRSRRSAVEIAAMFFMSGLGVAIAIPSMLGLQPNNPSFIATIGLLIGIVGSIIGCSQLWRFLSGRIHEVKVTDEGVIYDGKEYPWTSVVSARSTPVLPNGVAYLFLRVNRGQLASCLSLPIEVRSHNPTETISELKNCLLESGYDFPWHSHAMG